MLELSDVHTYYGASHVLQGVTLAVGPGEIVTILGRNGMGKTTLIRSIIGFTPPRRGRVGFKGDDRGAGAPPGGRGRPRDRGAQARGALDPARRAEPAAGARRGRPRPHPEPRPDRALVGAGRPDGERSGQVPLSGRRLEPRRGAIPSRYLVLTIRSQSSAYSFWYCGHTFSSATLRKAATSLALTFIPFASRISLARWRLSTLSVASRTLACASRETSVNSLCASGTRLFQMSRFITTSDGP